MGVQPQTISKPLSLRAPLGKAVPPYCLMMKIRGMYSSAKASFPLLSSSADALHHHSLVQGHALYPSRTALYLVPTHPRVLRTTCSTIPPVIPNTNMLSKVSVMFGQEKSIT